MQVAGWLRPAPGPMLPSGVAAAPRWAHPGCMAQRIVTVNDLLDGHVLLDIECLDRIYLNAYVPILQSSGQVVAFMTQHLGLPIPSPALFDKISQRFRRAVASFAEANAIPWVKFARDDRKAADRVEEPHSYSSAHHRATSGGSEMCSCTIAHLPCLLR